MASELLPIWWMMDRIGKPRRTVLKYAIEPGGAGTAVAEVTGSQGNVELLDLGREIRTVAVFGGGTMGAGIARTVAGAGLKVLLFEKTPETLRAAHKVIEEELDRELRRWGITGSEKTALLEKIAGYVDPGEAAMADLVIESIDEDFASKCKLFAELDEVCDPGIPLITNTSTLSVSEIAAATRHPERVVGMHFVNPVPKTKVSEVVRGMATSGKTVAAVKRFSHQIGKTPIEVFEYPGYVTTRVILPLINEAISVVMEGVASAEDVDQAMKLGYNWELGPLALADRMGLDEVTKWMDHLFHELGDVKYRPSPLLRKMVRAGRLGVKTGEGFFRYE
jgi:3-hydroxybutyryl-CoA dehydrogenase